MDRVLVEPGSALSADVRELATRHRAWAGEHSPPEDVHAVEADGLADPAMTLLTARSHDGALLGIGALRELDPWHGEIKAMHVVAAARGTGTGRALLDARGGRAARRGYRRVSRQTGPRDAVAAARAGYASAGFAECAPFGSYRASPHSVCLARGLEPGP